MLQIILAILYTIGSIRIFLALYSNKEHFVILLLPISGISKKHLYLLLIEYSYLGTRFQ